MKLQTLEVAYVTMKLVGSEFHIWTTDQNLSQSEQKKQLKAFVQKRGGKIIKFDKRFCLTVICTSIQLAA